MDLRTDKSLLVRDFVLNALESGIFRENAKLPGARQIAEQTGVAFLTAQKAVSTLVQDGLLHSVPRKGVTVRSGWESCLLDNIFAVRYGRGHPFFGISETLREMVPEIRISSRFSRGMFEAHVTRTAQMQHDDFLDIRDLLPEIQDDEDAYFTRAFAPFMAGNRMFALPFIFSPRVMAYNPVVLERAGCARPRPGWSWDDFMACLAALRNTLPAEAVFGWSRSENMWMSIVFRAGGALIDPQASDPVMIDHPRTILGLNLWKGILDLLGTGFPAPNRAPLNHLKLVVAGRGGIVLTTRQELAQLGRVGPGELQTVPLPDIPGGRPLTLQATEVVCVRRECKDLELARRFLRAMLSRPVQDALGRMRYGIPVRKDSAMKSIDFSDPRDVLFLNEIPRMSGAYHLDSPELTDLIRRGIDSVWFGVESVETLTRDLAQAVRTFLRIRNTARIPA